MTRMEDRKENFSDIIDRPHPTSAAHRPMPLQDRAAQFSPFAALTGYDAAIAEADRITQTRHEPGDWELAELNEKLRLLLAAGDHPVITGTYFQPDSRKQGGAYVSVTDRLKKIRLPERELLLRGGAVISLDAVSGLSGSIFSQGNDDP